ncbi:MAG: 3-phosphoshikimate 1-carboxyvinyltransferase [bacterium]
MQIETCGPLNAVVLAPGSKSLTQRALLLAALAHGESRLKGALLCQDTLHLIRALRGLGATIKEDGPDLLVHGTGGKLRNPGREFFVGNNATALRFLSSALCLGSGTYRLTGSPRLCQRPVGPLLEALAELGGRVASQKGDGCAPILVQGSGALRGGSIKLDGSQSSQYASSLLLVAPLMSDGLELQLGEKAVSRPYVSLTVQSMRAFGVDVVAQESPRRFFVPGGQRYRASFMEIEGDLSSASYFLAAAALCGGKVRVQGVRRDTFQGDIRICQVLEHMGSRVTCGPDWIQVEGGPLRHGHMELDLGDAPDLVPTVAVVAAARQGLTRIAGVAHLRFKESDRLEVLAQNLHKAGVQVEQLEDGLVIHGGNPHSAEIDPHGDHRMAMSFAVLGLRVPGMIIRDPDCVAKSYPGFWQDLRKVGGSWR